MRRTASLDLVAFEAKAAQAAELLKALGNERRLMILCRLVDREYAVGELAEVVGLSQSALSQHLAKLRESKMVVTRRVAQTIYYRLAQGPAKRVLKNPCSDLLSAGVGRCCEIFLLLGLAVLSV